MLTPNIKFRNFIIKKNNKIKKKIKIEILSKDLIKKYPLLLSLTDRYQYSYSKKNLSKIKNYSEINLIGMGGSILGTEAIYDFLKHKIKKKFNFFNNIQPKKFSKSVKKKLNIIVSKSGNTLETISNFNLMLQKQKKNQNIFICEKRNNFLNLLAEKLKSEVFEHKNYIGGRYSVLSEVGMLPAELMGLNEKKFKRLNYLLKNKKFISLLIDNVSSIYHHVITGKKNSIILNYDGQSENLFKWYQQLVAESLGKKGNGILPIISSMPKDNHSLLQLYLDGPKNNFYTFFNVREKKSPKFKMSNFFVKFKYLENKSFYQILNSQKSATEKVFLKKKIPFRTFEVFNRTEEVLGELFCFFILETILLGNLLRINPFDQPSVELIKTERSKILN